MKTTFTSLPGSAKKGSVLIVALIFSIIIAISLGSFLQVATSASQISYRTYYQGVAMNIAETGLEQAMWELNTDSGAWASSRKWETLNSGYKNTFDLGTVEGGATAVVKVFAQPKLGTDSAYVIARAIITPSRGDPIEKWVKVTLSKKSRTKVGGLGRRGIVASGNNVVMGSWNSDPDKDPSTPFVPFSPSVMDDNMSLATLELDASLDSGQADVNGKAAVGSSSLNAIKVGPNGYIGPFGTAAGTKDPNSVSTNFTTDLPGVTAPSATYTSLGSVNSDLTLPRAGDTPGPDGVYYYSASEISLNGKVLAIDPGYEVVLNVPKSAGDAISVSGGGGAIHVKGTLSTNTVTGETTYKSGQLKIYTDGDIKISGQGAAVNLVTTQNYTPASSFTTNTKTKTTISGVQEVYGKGKYKDTVIGWSYTKTIVTEITTISGGNSSTTTNTTTNTYTDLKESGTTSAPVAGTTNSDTTSVGSTAESITDTGTLVGQPVNLQLYGTRTDADAKLYGMQDFSVSGNGHFSGIIYAPNADISAKGGGNSGFMYGSLVGNTLKFTGNDGFYYDESLGDSDEGSRLGIDDWDELVSYVDKDVKIPGSTTLTFRSLMDF